MNLINFVSEDCNFIFWIVLSRGGVIFLIGLGRMFRLHLNLFDKVHCSLVNLLLWKVLL